MNTGIAFKAPCIALISLMAVLFPCAAFEYSSLPDDNLIVNPWFRSGCTAGDAGWQKNVTSDGLSWGGSDKPQNPADTNCGGDWTGFAARWADQNSGGPFSPEQDALLWQVVGPVDPGLTTLHCKFLWVMHRLNKWRVRIYGANASGGPWTPVWTIIDTVYSVPNLRFSCDGGLLDRNCWWDSASGVRFPNDREMTMALSTGYPFYKLEFLANYPGPDASATGDVGVKVTRVYFSVSRGGALRTMPAGKALHGRATLCSREGGFVAADLRGRIIGNAGGKATQLRLSAKNRRIVVSEKGIVIIMIGRAGAGK